LPSRRCARGCGRGSRDPPRCTSVERAKSAGVARRGVGSLNQQWTDLQRYVIEEHFEEHFEDYTEGRISRRELLKRVGYIAGGAAASLAALTALGCNPDQPRPLGSGTAATSVPTPKPRVRDPALDGDDRPDDREAG